MKKKWVIHPLLFAMFPILFLSAHNIALISIEQITLPLLITLLSTVILFVFVSFCFRDIEKAGLAVSLFVLIFFSFGHFCSVMKNFQMVVLKHIIDCESIGFLSSSIFFLFWVYYLIKAKRNLQTVTKFLNVTAAILVVISLVKIGNYEIKTNLSREDNRDLEILDSPLVKSEEYQKLPNIYYIILDAYARKDVLREWYNFDNTDFVNYLTQKGFYVADRAKANYCQSFLSLAASLNLKYLDELVDKIGNKNESRRPGANLIWDNLVFQILKKFGYTTIAFDTTGWLLSQMKSADIFHTAPLGIMNHFYYQIINITPIPFIERRIIKKIKKNDTLTLFDLHRKTILNAFIGLETLSRQKGPFLVYAHILAPHQPFVFNENGEPINPDTTFTIWYTIEQGRNREEYIESYNKQLRFINNKLKETLEKIIANSQQSPIIILQADHGPASMLHTENIDKTNLKERMSILNAYYFPDNKYFQLYHEITPVNTFRIIFNQYFGSNFELLKDESYFSTWSHPYKFINVTEKLVD